MITPSNLQHEKQFLLLGLLISLIGAIFMFIFGIPPVTAEHNLQRHGKVTYGIVTDIYLRTGAKGTNRVTFEFLVNGNKYRGITVVARDYAASHQVGQRIPITYLPSNPKICRSENSTEYNLGVFHTLVGAGAVLFATAIIIRFVFLLRTKFTNSTY